MWSENLCYKVLVISRDKTGDIYNGIVAEVCVDSSATMTVFMQ